MELRKTFRFEASHILPEHPGKCSRLHGHSWVLHVYVSGTINPATGFVMDYADISEKVKPLVDDLDHKHLGQWCRPARDGHISSWGIVASPTMERMAPSNWDEYFYPSSECLAYLIGGRLKIVGLDWSKLEIEETCTSQAILTREEYEKSQS